MANYICGNSRLHLAGAVIEAGTPFTHDFTVTGPEGDRGPELESFLKRAGALFDQQEPAAAPVAAVAESTARSSRKA